MTAVPDHLSAALRDRYRLERELGEGGMATVYLAEDLRHDRKVAVKVLRPELAAVIGADRFLAEIKTTAGLQHPHILPLFDSGAADSFLFYVMPLVEGESLRDRLVREKQLPIADAVRIATEVAGALDYAHRHGVIHRDIKPENILLHDGRALVADFGIALAASRAGGNRMTETGMSLGTPHYMSPEQAMGEREITARSDVYALGCITYEMLVGEPPFTGPSAQAVVARVITEAPRGLVTQRHTIPAHVEAAVLTALEKLPADRFATAAEFAAALDGSTPARSGSTTSAGRAAAPERTARATRSTGLLVAGLALSVALAAWGWLRPHGAAPLQVRRYAVGLPGAESISLNGAQLLALAPGGERMAYVSRSAAGVEQIWIRDFDQLDARPLAGTISAGSPTFSPDGKQLAFMTVSGALAVIAVEGGTPTVVADSINASSTEWGEDGFVYASAINNTRTGMVRVPASGGRATPVTVFDTGAQDNAHLFPALLPNRRGVVFSIWYGPTRVSDSDIAVADFKTGKPRILLHGLRARYSATGHLLVVRTDGSMIAVPFDQDRMTLTGPPVPLMTGVAISGGYSADFDVSRTGTLAYYAGEPTQVHEAVRPVWVTRDGRASLIDSTWRFDRPFNGGLSLSPDGRQLAVAIAGDRTSDIWIKQLDRGPLSRLTFEAFLKYRPVGAPDGKTVAYLVDPGNNSASIYRKRADGSGAEERMLGSTHSLAEAVWSRDAEWMVVRTTVPSRDIMAFHPGKDTALVPLVASPKFDERAATLSPDGRFMAYESDESGRYEVYVRPFPKTDDGRWQVTSAGGGEPLWSRGGREIFYRAPTGQMMSAPVTTAPSFTSGAARTLFETKGFARSPGNRAYDVTPDDQRFVMLRLAADSAVSAPVRLVFVDNWLQELAAKLKRP